ncbi:MAG: pyridoxamine 5'-phosphate oxidase family protein [Chloroflexaceae bacterium]|jgi:PPOX class probable F420-dependent enzyme|nr:pyridoxamine 5'-phosphate oxidase family protein [Chloroflexaceae bacterium]
MSLSAEVVQRLEQEANIWLATVRADGRPHLVPLWFVWANGTMYLCMQAGSVKARNLRESGRAALALESGSQPVVCEGTATVVEQPWPEAARQGFQRKYDWDITTDSEYTLLVAVAVQRFVMGTT